MTQNGRPHNLDLLSGEMVEVRSREEILSTLDANGRLEAMPFMPEMLQYCGKRFRVSKRADKTCDNIKDWSLRRVENAVHLTGVRCDGASHGSCDAGCLIFWNEKWLKRSDTDFLKASQISEQAPAALTSGHLASAQPLACSERRLNEAVFQPDPSGTDTPVYTCQATQLREFTSTLHWWDLRQYLRDIRSGNLRREFGDSKSERFLESILGVIEVFRALVITTFNKFQGFRSGVQYPHIGGSLESTTPGPELGLQPGEFVQVRSKEEILSTLDRRNKNRGLLFDSEMLRYCGGTFRVLKRVNQIVDERTGKMMKMKSSCIILEGVACVSDYHRFCPRAIYHYWREGWLRRVDS